MTPEFMQEIKSFTKTLLNDIHTSLPGRITEFYPDKCEADVQPYGKFKTPAGKLMAYPKCPGVPLCLMQSAGQTASIVFPVKPGDECLLLFSEQALDTWRANAESSTDLKFDLTNAVAIVGLFARVNPLVKIANDLDAVIIQRGSSRVMLRSSGIDLSGNVNISGSLNVSGNLTANGVNLTGI